MRAVAIKEFGGNDKLQVMDLPRPTVGAKEILVKIHASGVNPVDYKIRDGHLAKAIPHAFPLVLGWECAGVVEDAGSGVTRFRKGEAVYAYCRKDTVQHGTYAEYIAIPETSAARKPARLSFAEAATIPLAGLTAWQMLFDVAGLMKDQTVLVHAAAGGVGGFATEFAHWRRAEVIATAATKNHEYVRNLGAKHTIDYQICDFRTAVREHYPGGVDVVLDTIGGETLRRSAELVKSGGKLISIVEDLDAKVLGRSDIAFRYVFVSPNAKQLDDIAVLIDRQFVTPHLTAELPLDQAAKGLTLMQGGHFRGKLALIV